MRWERAPRLRSARGLMRPRAQLPAKPEMPWRLPGLANPTRALALPPEPAHPIAAAARPLHVEPAVRAGVQGLLAQPSAPERSLRAAPPPRRPPRSAAIHDVATDGRRS